MPSAHSVSLSFPVLPASPGSAFQPDLFRPFPIAPVRPSRGHGPDNPRIAYRPQVHGTHAEFCLHPDFAHYRDEVTDNLHFLADFCRGRGMPDAQAIADRFNVFLKHRFQEAYFDRQVELVDSLGKDALDNFCDMIRDERIAGEKRAAAVRNLSEGVSVCASGAASNLIAADRALALSTESLRATLWQVKEETARNVLQQAVSRTFGQRSAYVGNEIHYVNAAWNYIADAFGLASVPDGKAPTLDIAFLNACSAQVRAAMTADRLAGRIAEQCLACFISQAAAQRVPPAGDMTAAIGATFLDIIEDIHRRHGLDDDALGLHGFVRLTDGDLRYALRSDASLVARDLLQAFHDEGLLQGTPSAHGGWHGKDGAWRALYTFGQELAWTAGATGRPSRRGAWENREGTDLVAVADLLAWCAAHGQADAHPPAAALRQAIRGADARDLADIPVGWVRGEEPLRELRARNAHAEVHRCLKANFSYFRGAMPAGERAGLVDDLMGTDNTVLALARDWYPDPWTLLAEVRDSQRRTRLQRWMAHGNAQAIDAMLSGPRRGRYVDAGSAAGGDKVYAALRGLEQKPALYEAMAAGKADAIRAWHRLLADPAVLDKVKGRLSALLTAALKGCTALSLAMYNGHAEAIRAYHAILADPAIVPHIRRALPSLVRGRSGTNVPGLVFALERGHADAVSAYGGMLADGAILPHIAHKLPGLLIARSPSGTNGLVQALLFDRAAAIEAFRALLVDPAILPHIGRAMYQLVSGTRPDGTPGLSKALEKNNADAIAAFHRLLTDPALLRHLQAGMRKLVLARDKNGTPGLLLALEKGCAGAIRAYHRLLVDPAVLPHVEPALPRLLAVRRADGTPGLALVLRNGNFVTLLAYRDLVADPRVLPHIRGVLPDLLAARDSSGTPGVVLAQRQGQAETVAAFRSMLEEPAIEPYIRDSLDELRSLDDAQQTAPAGDTPQGGSASRDGGSRAPRRSFLAPFFRRLLSRRLA